MPADKKFTGQRLDDTGLYYYGARYYDAEIGRFISADPLVSDLSNPQAFNRYSYVLNNPLRYVDPTGLFSEEQLRGWFGDWIVDKWKRLHGVWLHSGGLQGSDWWRILLAADFGR